MTVLFLLDTNVFSDFMAHHPRVTSRINQLSPQDHVITSTTVRGEVLYGIERLAAGSKRDNLLRQALERFRRAPAVPVPVDAAEHYSQIKLERERAGARMDENDLWIAASARSLGATLVTRDSDFANVPGLAVEDWTR